jgi:hypothetical protein
MDIKLIHRRSSLRLEVFRNVGPQSVRKKGERHKIDNEGANPSF